MLNILLVALLIYVMKVFGYCRVSTSEQADGGVSLDAQQQQITGYAMMKGWQGPQGCNAPRRHKRLVLARLTPHGRLPMASARRQIDGGGFHSARPFVGRRDRATLCIS
jgi:hypothetical protein